MEKAITLTQVLKVIPGVVLFASMVAGYTSLKSDVKYIKEKVAEIAAQQGTSADKISNHEVRISVLENRKSGSTQTISHLVMASPQPITISSHVTVKEESASPQPQPTPSATPNPGQDNRVVPSPLELVERLLK